MIMSIRLPYQTVLWRSAWQVDVIVLMSMSVDFDFQTGTQL